MIALKVFNDNVNEDFKSNSPIKFLVYIKYLSKSVQFININSSNLQNGFKMNEIKNSVYISHYSNFKLLNFFLILNPSFSNLGYNSSKTS